MNELAPSKREHPHTAEWRLGYQAFCQGRQVTEVPFRFEDDEAIEWIMGYGAAQRDTERGTKS